MSYELIITEKPAAAKKIAEALADGKAIKENIKGVPYYKVTHGNNDIVVACAVGHLYGLDQKDDNAKWTFPIFDIAWRPNSDKSASYSRKYLNAIQKLSKDAKEFTVATDYDVEGEVIGLNVVRFACKQKDANRMKFSTLTKDELVKAYENKKKTLDWGQANAGETRHFLDWYNGINYSRALTSAYKSTGGFKVLSMGRVQGPALKIIVDREKDIQKFKPEPYWQVELKGKAKDKNVDAWHVKDKIWKKEEADEIITKTKVAKKGTVVNISKSTQIKQAPNPFDLTSLQIESYGVLKIQPKVTLALAQELYISGYISYPRTSSQQLPKSIGYSKILKQLERSNNYSALCKELLGKSKLEPNNGKKTDPAHPAIYPTGIIPGDIDGKKAKLYDLIVKRFLATFAEPAKRETLKVEIDVKKEIFIAKGTRTVEKGWFRYYEPYVNLKEEELPKMEKDDEIDVKKIILHDKETLPPKRYTPSSIIKELEKRNLGTKATRASIVDTLFQRNYVFGNKSIEASTLGILMINTLENHAPMIIDEELTRVFEEDMEKIREGKEKKEQVLDKAKNALVMILDDLKKDEKTVGKKLKEANYQANEEMNTLGQCPVCKEGNLIIRKGKFGSFAACDKYPDCKTTMSLPANCMIKKSDKTCEQCGYPKVLSIRSGKKPQELCINPKCKSKYAEGDAGELAKEIAKGEVEKKCPKCKDGNLVLRKSIYGSFLGCSNYPKCKYTEKLEDEVKKENGTK